VRAIICDLSVGFAMKARRTYIVAGLLVVLAAGRYLRPAWESEASIRIALLEVTPVGTSLEHVRSLAESRGWIPPDVRTDSHVAFGTGTDLIAFSGPLRRDPFPYRTVVAATWEFNRSNQLVNIRILRHE
jgi:hypothetical protein